jgi:hypothetical protein
MGTQAHVGSDREDQSAWARNLLARIFALEDSTDDERTAIIVLLNKTYNDVTTR